MVQNDTKDLKGAKWYKKEQKGTKGRKTYKIGQKGTQYAERYWHTYTSRYTKMYIMVNLNNDYNFNQAIIDCN